MKKLIIIVVAVLMSVALEAATISRIDDNGKINGVQSSVVVCSSGARHVLYYKNGGWYHGSLGHMGDKYRAWSLEQVGNYACQEL